MIVAYAGYHFSGKPFMAGASWWENNDSITSREGRCFKTQQPCRADPSTDGVRTDIACGGYPCQPFSQLRQKNGDGARTGCASAHPAFNTLFEGFFRFLDVRRPHCWWIEEVLAFNHARADLGGKTALQVLAAGSARRGYAVRAKVLCHGCCVKIPRTRIFVWEVDGPCGGGVGADWVTHFICEVLRFRLQQIATPLAHLVRHDDPQEVQRMKMLKDLFFFVIVVMTCNSW